MAQDTHARTLLRLGVGLLSASALVTGGTVAATAAVPFLVPSSVVVVQSPSEPSSDEVSNTSTVPADIVEPTGAPSQEPPAKDEPSGPAKSPSPKPSKSTGSKPSAETGVSTGNGGQIGGSGSTTNQLRQPTTPQRQAPAVQYERRTGFPLDPSTGYAVHPRTGLLIVPSTGAMVVRGSLARSDFVYDFDARVVKLAPAETASASSSPETSTAPPSSAPSSSAKAKPAKSTSPAPSPDTSKDADVTRQAPATSTQATTAAAQSGISQPAVNAAVGVVVALLGLWYFFAVFRRPKRNRS